MKLLKPFSKNLIVMDLGHLILMSYWNCSKIIRLICRKIRLYKCFKEISLLYKNLKLSLALRMTYKGLRMFLKWFQNGFRMFLEWFQNGFRMVLGWFLNGFRMVLEWFQNGFRIVLELFQNCFRIVLECFKNGFRIFLQNNVLIGDSRDTHYDLREGAHI